MFDRDYIRLWIVVGWVVLFVGMWLIFEYTISGQVLVQDLAELEKSVATENWSIASQKIKDLEKHWEERKISIQANNATSEVNRFSALLSQAKTLITYEEDDALGSIGELKNLATAITKVFPEP